VSIDVSELYLDQEPNAIDGALTLNYDPKRLVRYYDHWSESYDHDVWSEQYSGPSFVADYLTRQSTTDEFSLDLGDRNVEILDVGCGTGLVGIALQEKGYRYVDGIDLSEAMIAVASKTNAYRSLMGGYDIHEQNDALDDGAYPIVVSCGVFTTGHVAPSGLNELLRLTRPGGICLVSTRKSYFAGTDFKLMCNQVQQSGRVRLADCIMNGPYLRDEGAHYWVFEVLAH